jgi:hypothetical protein
MNKHWHEMTTNERIRRAGWFDGTERQWQELTTEQREEIAFKGCGCLSAYPTWETPVNCVHPRCQIRRGEKPAIYLTNCILRSEMERGWLRFHKDSKDGRKHLAQLVRSIRRKAIETGIYDPWEIPGGWQSMVATGIHTF